MLHRCDAPEAGVPGTPRPPRCPEPIATSLHEDHNRLITSSPIAHRGRPTEARPCDARPGRECRPETSKRLTCRSGRCVPSLGPCRLTRRHEPPTFRPAGPLPGAIRGPRHTRTMCHRQAPGNRRIGTPACPCDNTESDVGEGRKYLISQLLCQYKKDGRIKNSQAQDVERSA